MMRLLRVPLCLAVLALVLGSPVRLGAVQPPEPDVTGIWNGFFISNTTEGDAGVVRLVIDSQKNRRFAGTLHVNPGSGFEIPFNGTLAASGHFTVIGNGDMGRFVVTGDYQEGARGVQYANAQYRLWVPGQPIDEGTLDLLQVPKQPAAQDLGGAWQGTFSVGDVNLPVGLSVEPGRKDPNGGVMFVATGENQTFTFDVFHAVGTDGRFVIVGLTRPENGPRACLHVFGQLAKDGRSANGNFELEEGINAVGSFHMDRVLIGDIE